MNNPFTHALDQPTREQLIAQLTMESDVWDLRPMINTGALVQLGIAGYKTLQSLFNASDNVLLGVYRVGPVRLKEIRQILQEVRDNSAQSEEATANATSTSTNPVSQPEMVKEKQPTAAVSYMADATWSELQHYDWCTDIVGLPPSTQMKGVQSSISFSLKICMRDEHGSIKARISKNIIYDILENLFRANHVRPTDLQAVAICLNNFIHTRLTDIGTIRVTLDAVTADILLLDYRAPDVLFSTTPRYGIQRSWYEDLHVVQEVPFFPGITGLRFTLKLAISNNMGYVKVLDKSIIENILMFELFSKFDQQTVSLKLLAMAVNTLSARIEMVRVQNISTITVTMDQRTGRLLMV